MNTITKKKILSPIVEIISELIILNEEVTENNSDFPDITNFANAVSKQIEQVVKVGYTYMNSIKEDVILQQKMPEGCNEVMEASKLLLQSAELLKQDTKSKEGRDMLVVAIQTILSGITNVLDIYDETEIRKIKAISQYIRELIDSTNQEKSVQDSISTLRQLSQCSMALAAQVNNRIPELLSHQSQLRLRISVNTISKITPLLLNSYKAILKNFDSDSITTSKCIICNILKRTCQDIDNIVSDDDSKTIETSKGGSLTQMMENVHNYQYIFQQLHSKKQYKNAFDLLEKYLSSYNSVLNYIKEQLPIIYDPNQKQNISATIGLLKRKEVDFIDLIKNCQNSNYPYSLRNQLVAELEYRTEYLLYLKDLFNKCVISSIVVISDEMANSTNMDSLFGSFVSEAKAGTLKEATLQPYHEQQLQLYIESQKEMQYLKKYKDTNINNKNNNGNENESIMELIHNINKTIPGITEEEEDYPIVHALKIYKNQFIFILERVVNLLSNENLQIHKDVIFKKVSIIGQFYPLLLKTSYAIGQHKEESNFNLFYDNIINTWEYLVNDVKSYIINQEGVFSMKDLLDSSSLNINGHIKALCKNEDNNIEDLPVEYKSILATVNQLIDISKNECINTEDNSYRDRLKKSIKEIKNEMKFIGKNMNNREIKDSTRETFEKLNEAISTSSGDTSRLISDMTFADLSQMPLPTQQRDELERLKFSEIKNRLTKLKKEVETLDQIIRINRRYAISKELPPTPPSAMKRSSQTDYLLNPSSLALNSNNKGGKSKGHKSPLSSSSSLSSLSPLSPRSPISTTTRPNLRQNSLNSSTTSNISSTSNTSFSVNNLSFIYQSPLADSNLIVQPLNKDEATNNPIKTVAYDLKLAASKWKQENNPIIDKANVIAQKLDELSYYNQIIRSKPQAKKMLIRTAQEMMDCVKILNYAQKISETCTDKRLKHQLLNTVERINTIGQQLKVVVAVKSGSRFDMDGDKQLVICASNLVEAIKSLLRDSEAALLRSNYVEEEEEEKNKGKEKEKEKEIMKEKKIISDMAKQMEKAINIQKKEEE
jgi:hypothetical protein